MKTFAYIRNLHWLSIGLQLKQHFSLQDRHLQLVCSKALLSDFSSIGLRWGQELTSFAECQKEIQQSKSGEVGILLHHHEKAYADLTRILGRQIESKSINISFYADGYNNQLLHPDAIEKLISERSFLIPKELFFFDVSEKMIPQHLKDFNVVVVSSDTLSLIGGLAPLYEKARTAVAGAVDRAKGRKILLLMLRPWGSAGFHGGRLAVQAPAQKLAHAMAALLSRIEHDVGESLCVAIRPDSRDPDLMAEFMPEFMKMIDPRGFDINEFWPAHLTMEPFIYNFNHFAPSERLLVASLDSTASLPFLRLGKGDRHYIGAPESILQTLLDREVAADATRVKIGRVERHAEAIAKNYPLTLTRLEPWFTRATPSHSDVTPSAGG